MVRLRVICVYGCLHYIYVHFCRVFLNIDFARTEVELINHIYVRTWCMQTILNTDICSIKLRCSTHLWLHTHEVKVDKSEATVHLTTPSYNFYYQMIAPVSHLTIISHTSWHCFQLSMDMYEARRTSDLSIQSTVLLFGWRNESVPLN
jgi:hypothetical protein